MSKSTYETAMQRYQETESRLGELMAQRTTQQEKLVELDAATQALEAQKQEQMENYRNGKGPFDIIEVTTQQLLDKERERVAQQQLLAELNGTIEQAKAPVCEAEREVQRLHIAYWEGVRADCHADLMKAIGPLLIKVHRAAVAAGHKISPAQLLREIAANQIPDDPRGRQKIDWGKNALPEQFPASNLVNSADRQKALSARSQRELQAENVRNARLQSAFA